MIVVAHRTAPLPCTLSGKTHGGWTPFSSLAIIQTASRSSAETRRSDAKPHPHKGRVLPMSAHVLTVDRRHHYDNLKGGVQASATGEELNMPTKITAADVSVHEGAVKFTGTGGAALAQSLVQKNGLSLAELAHSFGFIHPTDISIEKDGSVTIKNANAAKKVEGMLQSGISAETIFDTNCQC